MTVTVGEVKKVRAGEIGAEQVRPKEAGAAEVREVFVVCHSLPSCQDILVTLR